MPNAMSEETYYAALGVSETATPLQIKAAYRNLLKKIHPDTVSTLSPNLKRIAEDATQEIIKAYSVLSNEDRRRRYDQQLVESRRQAAAAPSVPVPRVPDPAIPVRVPAERTRTRHSRVHYCHKCGVRKKLQWVLSKMRRSVALGRSASDPDRLSGNHCAPCDLDFVCGHRDGNGEQFSGILTFSSPR